MKFLLDNSYFELGSSSKWSCSIFVIHKKQMNGTVNHRSFLSPILYSNLQYWGEDWKGYNTIFKKNFDFFCLYGNFLIRFWVNWAIFANLSIVLIIIPLLFIYFWVFSLTHFFFFFFFNIHSRTLTNYHNDILL